MSYRTPKVQAFGSLRAAVGCLAIIIWFAYILGTGILENPKPNQTPMDSAKPALLWAQAAIALVAATLLLVAAYRQTKNNDLLELSSKNEPERDGFVSRMIHWTIAILFVALIPIGIFASIIPEDSWFRNHYYVVHKTIGVLVFALLIVPLFWNRRSQRPALLAGCWPLCQSHCVTLQVSSLKVCFSKA